MKRLLMIAAALAALTSPATALEVGKSIHFNTPRPIAVGCTNSNEATALLRLNVFNKAGNGTSLNPSP